MRKGFLGAIAALMAGTGLVWGQEPPLSSMPPDGGFAPGLEGVIPYPPPMNPEGLATNDVRKPNFWFGVDYLGWYARRSKFVYPLVTSSSAADRGILGANTTSILYQGSDGHRLFSGGRVNGGFFFSDDNRFGVEFGGWVLGDGRAKFAVESQGSGVPLLARPFVDSITGQNSAIVIASSNNGPGSVNFNYQTQSWGVDAHWMLNLFRMNPQSPWGYNLNVFAGMSSFSVRDSINIASRSDYFQNVAVPFNGSTVTTGQSLTVNRRLLFGSGQNAIFLDITTNSNSSLSTGVVDRFRTSNQFYGGEFGFSEQIRAGRWSLGLTGKLSVGDMHTSIETQGYSTLSQTTNQTITTQQVNSQNQVFGTTVTRTQNVSQQTVPGGIYAVDGVIGRRSHDTFAYMPEGILTLNYQFTPTISGSIGYSFLYVNKVVRAVDIINPVVDPAQIPTSSAYGTRAAAPPTNFFPYTSYWVQGLTAGLSIQY